MRECPFCSFDEGWVRESPLNVENRSDDIRYVVQCKICHSVGPESGSREMAESKWDGLLMYMDPVKDKEKFQEAINEDEFTRGENPYRNLNIGVIESVMKNTEDAYSRGFFYDEEVWRDIASFLLGEGYSQIEVEEILESKYMRWASYDADTDCMNLEKFIVYFEKVKKSIDSFLDREIRPELEEMDDENIVEPDAGDYDLDNYLDLGESPQSIEEDAMGGVSAPMATLTNTPGMGSSVPASSAAMTGVQQGSSSAIGSGDNWGNNLGTYTQDGKTKKKKSKKKVYRKKKKGINENNISPYDKLGVAMAQKMGIPLAFKKGKGDKDVEQVNIEEERDLDTKLVKFEDWAKKFVNENISNGQEDFSFRAPELENWEDPTGELVYIRTNDKRYPTEHVFYNPIEDNVYFYNIEDKNSVAYPRGQIQKDNWALPWVQKFYNTVSKTI